MKVFISWSGEKSKAAAVGLREWLPNTIQAVEPWMSQHDIDAGSRWNAELTTQLEQTSFGIICVTKANVTAPWLLFEAGALSKTLRDTFVCPYLVDLEPSDIPAGPLTQFQAKAASADGTLDLVKTINKALKEGALLPEQLKKIFDKWWPELEETLKKLPAGRVNIKKRSLEAMVEEILISVRGLSSSSRASLVGTRSSLLMPRGFKPVRSPFGGSENVLSQDERDELAAAVSEATVEAVLKGFLEARRDDSRPSPPTDSIPSTEAKPPETEQSS